MDSKQIKIYISGGMDGNMSDVRRRFSDAKDSLLANINCEVYDSYELGFTEVPLSNKTTVDWFKVLLSCDAIYLLDDWFLTPNCISELDLMCKMNKSVMFETPLQIYDTFIMTQKLRDCIDIELGYAFESYRNNKRPEKLFFARVLFCYYCYEHLKIIKSQIAKILNVSHWNVLHSLKQYERLLLYKEFKDMEAKVAKAFLS